MHLITGGFAQGKLEYAKKKYGIADSSVADASSASVSEMEAARLVCNLQDYIRLHHEGTNCELPVFRRDAIIICDEVGCGLIPLSREEREFREAAGRACCRLAEEAETVELVRCGIARRIK